MESKFRYHNPQQQIPQQFLCPISQKIMTDPVLNKEAISFQRQYIIQWINKNGNDPFSRQPLRVQQLKPNRGLRDAIHTYQKNKSKIKRQRLQLFQLRNLKETIQIRQKQLQKIDYKCQTPQKSKSKYNQQSNNIIKSLLQNSKFKNSVFQLVNQQTQRLNLIQRDKTNESNQLFKKCKLFETQIQKKDKTINQYQQLLGRYQSQVHQYKISIEKLQNNLKQKTNFIKQYQSRLGMMVTQIQRLNQVLKQKNDKNNNLILKVSKYQHQFKKIQIIQKQNYQLKNKSKKIQQIQKRLDEYQNRQKNLKSQIQKLSYLLIQKEDIQEANNNKIKEFDNQIESYKQKIKQIQKQMKFEMQNRVKKCQQKIFSMTQQVQNLKRKLKQSTQQKKLIKYYENIVLVLYQQVEKIIGTLRAKEGQIRKMEQNNRNQLNRIISKYQDKIIFLSLQIQRLTTVSDQKSKSLQNQLENAQRKINDMEQEMSSMKNRGQSQNYNQTFQIMTQQYQQLFKNYEKLQEQNYKLKTNQEKLKQQIEKLKQKYKIKDIMIKQSLKFVKTMQTLQIKNVNLTPDNKFGSLKKRYCSRLNAKVCKVREQNKPSLGLFSNEDLPNQESFKFSFRALQIHENKNLTIGIIQSQYKQIETWQQKKPHYLQYCFSNQTIIKPVNQYQNKMEQIYVKNADGALKQVPRLIDVTISQILNKITWHFNGKKQAECLIPQFMRNKKLCAYAQIWQKGDTIQFI